MVRLGRTLLVLVLLGASGCEEPECNDMIRSAGGLHVVQAEHPTGWGEPACDACHARASLHDRGCTPGVDLVEVRARVEADPSTESCVACHGENGSAP